MKTLHLWIVLSWIALPTVMYGGYSHLHLIHHGDRLTPFQTTWFRAGHSHAGVLLLMSLLYYVFFDQTTLPPNREGQANRPHAAWRSIHGCS